jgi:hypothetical protein
MVMLLLAPDGESLTVTVTLLEVRLELMPAAQAILVGRLGTIVKPGADPDTLSAVQLLEMMLIVPDGLKGAALSGPAGFSVMLHVGGMVVVDVVVVDDVVVDVVVDDVVVDDVVVDDVVDEVVLDEVEGVRGIEDVEASLVVATLVVGGTVDVVATLVVVGALVVVGTEVVGELDVVGTDVVGDCVDRPACTVKLSGLRAQLLITGPGTQFSPEGPIVPR